MRGCTTSGGNQLKSEPPSNIIPKSSHFCSLFVMVQSVLMKSLSRLSKMKHRVEYKTVNCYCPEGYMYLMSNVPRLIKTTHNCWYTSRSGGTCYMWVTGLVYVHV